MNVQVTANLLKVWTLPARPPYDRDTHLARLYDEASGDVVTLVCDEACVGALKLASTNTPITLEASARQIDLTSIGGKGKAYRLRVTAVTSTPGETS